MKKYWRDLRLINKDVTSAWIPNDKVWLLTITTVFMNIGELCTPIFCARYSYQSKFQITKCCDMGQNDTIGKIELIPAFVLSESKTNC